MPRTARIVHTDIPYHLVQRGNNHLAVFHDAADFQRYLDFLRTFSHRYHLDILAYCLMTSHVHIVGIPRQEVALARGMGKTSGRYTQYANTRNGWRGHLWDDRFHSFPVDESALVAVMRYVECNPVRAGIVPYTWEYPWSSAAAHLGGIDLGNLLDLPAWFSTWKSEDWRTILTREEDPAIIERIRRHAVDGTLLRWER